MAQGKLRLRAASGLLACMAFAAHGRTLGDGAWRGVVRDTSHTVRASVQRQGDLLRVHFGEPRNCNVSAELLEEAAGKAVFRFKPAFNGGAFCEALYPGEILLIAGEKGATTVRFLRATVTWSGDLADTAEP